MEEATKLRPQVVLLDTGLRSQNSLRVVHAIKARFPETP
jgi:DNA-binding NarL/FixJ family response regulator